MARAWRVTYRRSCIGYRQRHRATLRSLGLRKLGQSRVLPDSPSVRGMLRQVAHLVEAEPVDVPDDPLKAEAAGGEGA